MSGAAPSGDDAGAPAGTGEPSRTGGPSEPIGGARGAGAPTVLGAEHVSKRYGPVTALRDVQLHLRKSEILGLIGDNGAGKSTLLKILSGFHQPSSGKVLLDGNPAVFRSVAAARAAGIEIVYQDLALVDGLSIAQNIFLGREHYFGPLRTLPHRRMRREAKVFLERLGLSNLPGMTADVRNLSGGQRQAVALARALYSKPRILLLDEPTAAMGARETAHFLQLVGSFREEQGVSILFVNHNYAQLLEVADRVALLRNGRIRFEKEVRSTSLEEISEIVMAEVRRELAGMLGGTPATNPPASTRRRSSKATPEGWR